MCVCEVVPSLLPRACRVRFPSRLARRKLYAMEGDMKTTKRRRAVFAMIVLTAALVAASTAQAAPYAGRGPGGGGGGGGGSTTPLSSDEMMALSEAINEEYLAFNTYTAVIRQLGSIVPFSNIVNAEQNHYSAVGNLFTKYGLPVPPNTGVVSTTWPTRKAACATGVLVELDDIALYDRWLQSGFVKHSDIINVFTNLRSASINNHLPAFQGCD